MRKYFLIICIILSAFSPAFAKEPEIDTVKEPLKDKVKNKINFQKDQATLEAEYLKRVEKERIKEEYGRKILDRTPSGFMTMDEYNNLSSPKDKAVIDYGLPKVDKPYDMQYVPQPIYRLARYNDPPGTPDLSIKRELFTTRQLNLPGITSPDFSIMVYPAVYYYPARAAVTCDLFMIALRDNDSSVNKILKANIANRFPDPILSTDKELTNSSAFRTLTPIDFSEDGTKLLVKEKIGSSADGIWQTKAIIYDFKKRTSYDLIELRYAISYYWKEYKGMDLEDKRWDIYPLGFSKNDPERIVAAAYAYTGEAPIFLGIWSIDTQGEQSRLLSLTNGNVAISSNGFKIVKDGAVNSSLVKTQEKLERNFVKQEAKNAEKVDKQQVKEMKTEMRQKLKEVDNAYKIEKENYNLMNQLEGTTILNDIPEKYSPLQEELDKQREIRAEKEKQKQIEKEEKLKLKEQKKQQKNSVTPNSETNVNKNTTESTTAGNDKQ